MVKIERTALELRLKNEVWILIEALKEGFGELDHGAALNCLVTALTAPTKGSVNQFQ